MKRFVCSTALILTGTLVTYAAQAQQQKPPIAKIEKLKDNLFLIRGGDPGTKTFTGGNVAVYVAESGVVLVDSMLSGYGNAILQHVKSVTDKPVKMLINTHTHFDHTGSNTELPANVEFVAHENTKANLSRATCLPVTNCDAFKGANAKFLPGKTFSDRTSLLSGKDRIDLYHFGRGHTNGDTWVVFAAARAVHTGDMFGRKHPPFIDPNSGGSGIEFASTLSKAVAGLKDIDTVIPGHAQVEPWSALPEFLEYYKEFLGAAEAGLKAGKSVDEVAASYKPSPKFAAYGQDPARIKGNIEVIAGELKR
jgi:glyoxylase-like metal-dependent hydrolase (beta-lactamase superfamily II)